MEEIFSKQVPFFFKASEREERKCHVRVQMGYDTSLHDSRKELVVKLTNDQDLYFLYTLHLAEEDFQSLKIQQGLLVDFTAFPQKVIDLLVMCLREEEKENPKFIVQFAEGGSSLTSCSMNLVETNPFRHLNHLTLKFLPGSDADVKTHLAGCLKQLKDSYKMIQHKFEHTSNDLTQQLEEKEQILKAKTSELDSLKHEWASRQADVSSKHKEDLTMEKEKTIQFQSSLQVRFEKERRELEQVHAKTLQQLESRLDQLESSNKELTEHKYRSEATIRDYKGRNGVLEEEGRRIKAELQTLRKENGSLDSLRLDMDKSRNSLQTRVAVLEQELRDKVEVMAKAEDLILAEKEKRKRAESEIEKGQREISRLESKTKNMSEELKKGNEIIKKLQGEIKSYHAKVKLRTQIATEQEKLLGEKDQELERLRQDLATCKDSLRDTQDKNDKLTSNLEQATQKLEESKKVLKTNENMIQWLNKQINEQRVAHNHLGTFESASAQMSHLRLNATPGHNSSTSSHGSVLPHDDLRSQVVGHLRGRPQASAHQVQYQAPNTSTPLGGASSETNPRVSALPVRQVASGHQPNSPREQLQHQQQQSTIPASKNPPIDPKFLVRREEAVPIRSSHQHPPTSTITVPGLNSNLSSSQQSASRGPANPNSQSSSGPSNHHHHAPLPSSHPIMPHVGSVRLSQDLIVPKAPLASAYFPNAAS